MKLSTRLIRKNSVDYLSSLGVIVPSSAPPLLEDDLAVSKSLIEVAHRALAIFSAVCVVAEPARQRRITRDRLRAWLVNNGLDSCLTQLEREIVFGGTTISRADETRAGEQIESLLTLAWTMSQVDSLDPRFSVDDSFGEIFPNVELGSPASSFLQGAKMRSELDLVKQLDRYYCLDWAYREASIHSNPAPLPTSWYLIRNRRWALEWLFESVVWEEISLDT